MLLLNWLDEKLCFVKEFVFNELLRPLVDGFANNLAFKRISEDSVESKSSNNDFSGLSEPLLATMKRPDAIGLPRSFVVKESLLFPNKDIELIVEELLEKAELSDTDCGDSVSCEASPPTSWPTGPSKLSFPVSDLQEN